MRVEANAQAAECPAFIGNGHEEARREPVRGCDFAADERYLAAETHRADAEFVSFPHDARFKFRERRIRVYVIESAEELLLGKVITMCAIAANANTQRARRASLPLRLPNRMQETFADAFQISIRTSQSFEIRRQGILDVLVFTAAALEDELHFDAVVFPLLEMNHGRAFAEIVAAVLPSDRID